MIDFGLAGKTALITGATGGIGGAIARAFHGAGAQVILSGTRLEALETLAASLGDRAHVQVCDLADSAAVDGLIPLVESSVGPLDILVANAGITRDGLMLRMKDEDWTSVIRLNLESYFRLSRAALRGMMKRRNGRIIGITSVVGITGNPGQANYAASKAGMIGFSKSLAQEVASRGITVNCVAPGMIESPMTAALNETQRETIAARIPLARLGSGDDVAAACIYLASAAGRYVTGQTLHVNGGMAMP